VESRFWTRRTAKVAILISVAVLPCRLGAQNHKRVVLDEKWGLTEIEVSANSENQIRIVAIDPYEMAFISGACPSKLTSWTDAVDAILNAPGRPSPGESIETKSPELNSLGWMYLTRTVSRKTTKNVLVVSLGQGRLVAIPLRDSLVRVFLASLRSAAKTQLEMTGDPCLRSSEDDSKPRPNRDSLLYEPPRVLKSEPAPDSAVYPPRMVEGFIPPLPIPTGVRGFHFLAEFDVDTAGKVTAIDFTPTRDSRYNRRLEDLLKTVRFEPGTTRTGRPVKSKAYVVYDF